MVFQRKPSGKQTGQFPHASIHIKHPITHGAMKMVVVRSRNFCQFVAIRLTRHGHGDQQAILYHPPNDAVNRSLAKRGHIRLGKTKNFVDRKGSGGALANLTDGTLLGGVAAFRQGQWSTRVPPKTVLISATRWSTSCKVAASRFKRSSGSVLEGRTLHHQEP